jgi:hypothetical protein
VEDKCNLSSPEPLSHRLRTLTTNIDHLTKTLMAMTQACSLREGKPRRPYLLCDSIVGATPTLTLTHHLSRTHPPVKLD